MSREREKKKRDEFLAGAVDPPEISSNPADPSRRRFVALVAASAALATSVSCSRNIDSSRAVPYTRKPEDVVPGVVNSYATAFQEGVTAYGVLAKVREGKPVHIEGNDLDLPHGGKAPYRAVGDLLSLYDPDRLRGPLLDGKPAGWDAAIGRVHQVLAQAKAAKQGVLLVTPALLSPTRRALLEELEKGLPGLVRWEYEPVESPGEPARGGGVQAPKADLRLDRARVIVSLEADFLGTWGDCVRAARLFAQGRKMPPGAGVMNRLYAFEGGMSLTGSNADHRFAVRPSALASLPFVLARLLHERHSVALPDGFESALLEPFTPKAFSLEAGVPPVSLEALAADLAQAGPSSLILAGPQLPAATAAGCHLLHLMLGAVGTTWDPSDAIPQPVRNNAFPEKNSPFAVAIFWGVDPAYSDPGIWSGTLHQIPFRIALGLTPDETGGGCQVVLPIHHWLESWGDFDCTGSTLLLQQPACRPLFGTRQAEDLVLGWCATLGATGLPAEYREFLKRRWQRDMYRGGAVAFEVFWNACLHDGVHRMPPPEGTVTLPDSEALALAARDLAGASPARGFEILLHPSHQVFDGRYGNNGWLQELPDPISKTTWGSPLRLAKADAAKLVIADGDRVVVKVGTASWTGPALVQPGQAEGVASLALGYGRRAGSVARGIGENAFALASSGLLSISGAAVVKASGTAQVHTTQMHHSLEGRDIVRWGKPSDFSEGKQGGHGDLASLYPDHEYSQHRWGMSIDLSACIGCAGCVVACQSENNIPAVGPEQVERGREMHWMRIDRYYEGPAENPVVLHQPMLCQHCSSAPCENVCPVNATGHSPEGLNQMAYNRCVGTRYCANNCPYKVRRFNFFDYTKALQEPLDLAMNPEVTLRPRGVMEKCTFCIQRIQEAKQSAKAEGRPFSDRDIRTACAAACPTDAILFGDLKDPGSEVSHRAEDPRGFKVLEELGVRPAITYLARLRNPGEE